MKHLQYAAVCISYISRTTDEFVHVSNARRGYGLRAADESTKSNTHYNSCRIISFCRTCSARSEPCYRC